MADILGVEFMPEYVEVSADSDFVVSQPSRRLCDSSVILASCGNEEIAVNCVTQTVPQGGATDEMVESVAIQKRV